jgi:methylated-DNA-[protein]-cysteine S-methyltransferase
VRAVAAELIEHPDQIATQALTLSRLSEQPAQPDKLDLDNIGDGVGHSALLSTGSTTTEMYHRPPTVGRPISSVGEDAACSPNRGFVLPAGQNGNVTAIGWATIETPVGQVSVGCSDVGVAKIRFGPPPAREVAGSSGAPDDLLSAARAQLSEYFCRARTVFDMPLDWGNTSGAQRQVLSLLAETVRYGETTTYGSLARRLALRDGRPAIGARGIGSIMGSNPIPVIVPCHRVLAADGLGGFSGGSGVEVKRWLLTFEGALPAMLDFEAPAVPAT